MEVSQGRIAGGTPVFVLYLTCFLFCPRLRFGFLVLLTIFPPDTANRCLHPALRPSTCPSVVLDCTDFRHCRQWYVRRKGELCVTWPFFTANRCPHPCLRPSTCPSDARLHSLLTVRAAVCVHYGRALDDFAFSLSTCTVWHVTHCRALLPL